MNTGNPRRNAMLGDIDPQVTSGIEIGALHAPMIQKSEGDIRYVDYATAEVLRSKFVHENVDPALIVETDIIWGEHPLNTAISSPLDYAVASHAIEHVPDLLGWLLEIHAVLKTGGSLGLAIPDKRYTFDEYRQESFFGEIIEAYVGKHRRPSARQVFEAMALSKNAPAEGRWQPGARGDALPREMLHRLSESFRWLQEVFMPAPYYVDVHCWVFTPASFLDLAEGLAAMKCFPYRIAGFSPTTAGSIEFFVRLETVADPADPVIYASVAQARDKLVKQQA